MSISVLKKRFSTGSTSGFTLVELLVVIAIIGVLATLVLLQLGTARAKARDTKRISDVNQIRSAVELFSDATATGGFPAPVVGQNLNTATNFQTIYFASAVTPTDPVTGAEYPYTAGGAAACAAGNSSATQYHIRTELEQRSTALGTDSDINSLVAVGAFVATTCGIAGVNDSLAATEANPCTAAAGDCQFDLGQR